MRRFFTWILVIAILLPVLPAYAQDGACGDIPASTLVDQRHAVVAEGYTAPIYDAVDGALLDQLNPTGDAIHLMEGPVCGADSWWWQVSTTIGYYGMWMPETVTGDTVLEPYVFTPEPPVALGVPMNEPVITDPAVSLPAVDRAANPDMLDFGAWDWDAYMQDAWYTPADPMTLTLPETYGGDLPGLPVNLDTAHFVQDAGLNADQLALLAQNGFVVVPGDVAQFDAVYGYDAAWSHEDGKGDFITTDALLHSLFITYQNALMFLEMNEFYGRVAHVVGSSYQAAEAQLAEATGTALESPARNAAVYYVVPLMLLAEGEDAYKIGYEMTSGFREGALVPSAVLADADPAILEAAQPIVDTIRAGEGRLEVPVLDNYTEDFSQYAPRGYYAGNPLLESYFRSMMWMGRITFRAQSEADTLTGLMVLRALTQSSGGYEDWTDVAQTLEFLVGPMDDYSAPDYLPLAEDAFGAGLPLDALAGSAQLDAFLDGVQTLPAPRINSIPLPLGTTADEVDALTRGFRLFGQRFTLDGYIMQQLIYPEVGTATNSRALPLGLDVAAALGSDDAYRLAEAAGATAYANYTENMTALRAEIDALDGAAWLENLYGGWLWALQPLLVRDPATEAPMMQTDAWRRKNIHTSLGSWTELKHATLLYAEQPMGGLGGGGVEPPVISTSYVEPNPLVFARIAIVAATLDTGLAERGFYRLQYGDKLSAIDQALTSLAILSARLATISRQEIAGEPVSYEDLYWMQENMGSNLFTIRYLIEEQIADPPENVALVADVASNADAGVVLEEAIGTIDYIYVVTNGMHGLQLTRGGVYSYYEFTQPIDARLTDDAWREMVATDDMPARPDWIALYFSD